MVRVKLVLVGLDRDNLAHLHAGIQRDTITQRPLEQTTDVLEGVIRAVSWDEAPKKRAINPELGANSASRPYLYALAVFRGESDLLANTLFVYFTGRYVEPTPGRKYARDSFVQNPFSEELTISQCETKHQGSLSLCHRPQNLDGRVWMATLHEEQSLSCQPFVDPDRVLRYQLKIAAVASARLTRWISLIKDDHAIAGVSQTICGSCPGQPGTDHDDVGPCGKGRGSTGSSRADGDRDARMVGPQAEA